MPRHFFRPAAAGAEETQCCGRKTATKKPTRRLAFLATGENLITSSRRERLQRAWQRQQPEQQRQRAWQRQQPEQRRERLQRAWLPEREQQRERGPELQRASALPSCRKRKQRVQREQQPGEIVSLLISLIDK
jgi:hypothetical protein